MATKTLKDINGQTVLISPSNVAEIDVSNLTNNSEDLTKKAATVSELNTGLGGKVDKVDGKGLSTNDFTTEQKTKLEGISSGATKVQDNHIVENGTILIDATKTIVYDDSEVRGLIAGKETGYVINALTDITGTETTSGYKNVTVIGTIDLTKIKIGDNVYVKDDEAPDYWVSNLTGEDGVCLTILKTKIDLSGYYTKSEVNGLLSPITSNVSALQTKTTNMSFADGETTISGTTNLTDVKVGGSTLNNTNLENGSGIKSLQQTKQDDRDFKFKNPNYTVPQEILTEINGTVSAEGFVIGTQGAYGEESFEQNGTSVAHGKRSVAQGWSNIAYGVQSHAEGNNTASIGEGSHTEGARTTATGLYSHAEGGETLASGNYSHASGNNTQATENYSTAIGSWSKARGQASFAGGTGCDTTGMNSFVFGKNLIGIHNDQAIFGQFNNGNKNALFIVGNGTNGSNRSNSFEVYKDGSAKVALMGTDNLSVATKQYVDEHSSSGTKLYSHILTVTMNNATYYFRVTSNNANAYANAENLQSDYNAGKVVNTNRIFSSLQSANCIVEWSVSGSVISWVFVSFTGSSISSASILSGEITINSDTVTSL